MKRLAHARDKLSRWKNLAFQAPNGKPHGDVKDRLVAMVVHGAAGAVPGTKELLGKAKQLLFTHWLALRVNPCDGLQTRLGRWSK